MRKDPLDPAHAMFGRRDLDGVEYNSRMLEVAGTSEDSDRLLRYYLRGSNDRDLTDVTEEQAQHLISAAVGLGRHGGQRPDEP